MEKNDNKIATKKKKKNWIPIHVNFENFMKAPITT